MMKRAIQLYILTHLLFFFTGTVIAASEDGAGSGSELHTYFRMLWGLCIVLGIMLVMYGLVRKRFNVLGGASGDRIKILEIKPVMPKKSLCLVSVKGREYLIGIAGESITLLADTGPDKNTSFQDILEQSGDASS